MTYIPFCFTNVHCSVLLQVYFIAWKGRPLNCTIMFYGRSIVILTDYAQTDVITKHFLQLFHPFLHLHNFRLPIYCPTRSHKLQESASPLVSSRSDSQSLSWLTSIPVSQRVGQCVDQLEDQLPSSQLPDTGMN